MHLEINRVSNAMSFKQPCFMHPCNMWRRDRAPSLNTTAIGNMCKALIHNLNVHYLGVLEKLRSQCKYWEFHCKKRSM